MTRRLGHTGSATPDLGAIGSGSLWQTGRRYRRHLYRCRARSGRAALQRQDPDDARGARARGHRGDPPRAAARPALAPADLSIIIHGTTLATNALIERKGAKTALLTTEGFRDTIEIRHENRFEQYDVNIDLPPPLVPRRLRFPVRERIDAQGRVLVPLDEAGVAALAERLAGRGDRGVAVGFLHSFTNPAHERRAGEILADACPVCRLPCRARCRPRCASTSASRPPAPTPMSSR